MQQEQEQEQLEDFLGRNKILADDTIYHFDQEEHNKLIDDSPWQKDPDYFTDCKISINALIKMLIHACLGKNNEVMGLMQGRCVKNTFIIYDIIQLNAEASETNVSLTSEAMEGFVSTLDCLSEIGRDHAFVGWYHSHPSYGCWLSGTDIAAQELQQKAYGAFVAVVVDPIRSMTNQKIDIGAFRVYPRGYKVSKQQGKNQEIVVPAQKIKDFGCHHERYYSLNVEFFSNSLDSKIVEGLWKQFWGVRLAQNSLQNHQQYFSCSLCDLRDKCFLKYDQIQGISNQTECVDKQQIKDSAKYSNELAGVLMSETVKSLLFK